MNYSRIRVLAPNDAGTRRRVPGTRQPPRRSFKQSIRAEIHVSDKDRRKKDGHDAGKERQAMREGPEFKKRQASEQRQDTHDEVDVIKYKSGSARDRTRSGAP